MTWKTGTHRALTRRRNRPAGRHIGPLLLEPVVMGTQRGLARLLGIDDVGSWRTVANVFMTSVGTLCLTAPCCFVRILLRPSNGAEYCDQPDPSVCVSVCPRAYFEPLDRSARNIEILFADPLSGRGSVLIRRHCAICAALCTSGFMDDVTLGRNRRDAERWRRHRVATAMNGVAIPGRSLMSMNACFSSCF